MSIFSPMAHCAAVFVVLVKLCTVSFAAVSHAGFASFALLQIFSVKLPLQDIMGNAALGCSSVLPMFTVQDIFSVYFML